MRSIREIAQLFPNGRDAGLTDPEVADSRARFGANRLTPLPRQPVWKKFLEKFDEPIIKILLAASLLKIVVDLFEASPLAGGLALAAVVTVLVVALIANLGEYRSDQEFEKLNAAKDSIRVKVHRDGHVQTVALEDVTVGDLVLLE